MITNEGLELIKYFENCRLKAYQDSAGIWTIGYGSTKGVKKGMVIDQTEAERRLTADVVNAEKRVDNFVKIELQTCERDSLISSAFNLRSFPVLANYLNQDRELFLRKIVLYCCDVKGRSLLGLKRRRYAESWMFSGMPWEEIKPKLAEIV